jgi:monovalent cation/hydrogen antiporter
VAPWRAVRPGLNELAENDAAPDAVIDRLRAVLEARIGSTRDRMDQDPDTELEAVPERELRAGLVAAENAELSRLFEDGSISAATRQRLQRSLDLEVTRLAERQCKPWAMLSYTAVLLDGKPAGHSTQALLGT